jgi:hypothetical protein
MQLLSIFAFLLSDNFSVLEKAVSVRSCVSGERTFHWVIRTSYWPLRLWTAEEGARRLQSTAWCAFDLCTLNLTFTLVIVVTHMEIRSCVLELCNLLRPVYQKSNPLSRPKYKSVWVSVSLSFVTILLTHMINSLFRLNCLIHVMSRAWRSRK